MNTDHTAYRSAVGVVALAAAPILVAVGVLLWGQGDLELMFLSMLPLIIIGAIAPDEMNESD